VLPLVLGTDDGWSDRYKTRRAILQGYHRVLRVCRERNRISCQTSRGTNATGPQCRKLIESVGHSNFGLWYDPANIFYYSDGRLTRWTIQRPWTGLLWACP